LMNTRQIVPITRRETIDIYPGVGVRRLSSFATPRENFAMAKNIKRMVARGRIELPTRGFSARTSLIRLLFYQQVTGAFVALFAVLFTTMHHCSTQNSRKHSNPDPASPLSTAADRNRHGSPILSDLGHLEGDLVRWYRLVGSEECSQRLPGPA